MRGPVPVAEGTEADGAGADGTSTDATGTHATGTDRTGAAGPWRDTLAAQDAVNGLLQDWDDEVAGRACSPPNVAQDRPLAQRRADIARLRERIGEFAPDPDRAAEFDSPAHCRWWLTGPRGSASVQIKLAPLTRGAGAAGGPCRPAGTGFGAGQDHGGGHRDDQRRRGGVARPTWRSRRAPTCGSYG